MSLITPKQVQLLNIAQREVQKLSNGTFDDAAYRLVLRNCGAGEDANGRPSGKLLDQVGFELVMAFLEQWGFRQNDQPDDYWRRQSSWRSGHASSRQVYEIKRLSALDGRYPLAAMCMRVSNNTHTEPEKLTPAQAYCLIEALKEIVDRNAGAAC